MAMPKLNGKLEYLNLNKKCERYRRKVFISPEFLRYCLQARNARVTVGEEPKIKINSLKKQKETTLSRVNGHSKLRFQSL